MHHNLMQLLIATWQGLVVLLVACVALRIACRVMRASDTEINQAEWLFLILTVTLIGAADLLLGMGTAVRP